MKITLLTGKTFDIKEAVGMDIKIVQSASSRKLILHIDSKERIPVLSIPKYCTRKRAVNFINENMDWILETLQKLPERKSFSDGETISLFGQDVTISHQPNARCGVRLDGDTLVVSGGAEFLHRRVKDYIRHRGSLFCHLHSLMCKCYYNSSHFLYSVVNSGSYNLENEYLSPKNSPTIISAVFVIPAFSASLSRFSSVVFIHFSSFQLAL